MSDFQLTPAALADLEGIWRYTAEQWGVDQAERYLNELNQTFAALARAPKTAPGCDHIRPGYRCQFVEHHVVYFKLEGATLLVVRVLHERMDAGRHV
ncbi:MAG: type II toxin-antitoxin system RelE/ParE family toxin [Burkholderiaceae bacterium]